MLVFACRQNAVGRIRVEGFFLFFQGRAVVVARDKAFAPFAAALIAVVGVLDDPVPAFGAACVVGQRVVQDQVEVPVMKPETASIIVGVRRGINRAEGAIANREDIDRDVVVLQQRVHCFTPDRDERAHGDTQLLANGIVTGAAVFGRRPRWILLRDPQFACFRAAGVMAVLVQTVEETVVAGDDGAVYFGF